MLYFTLYRTLVQLAETNGSNPLCCRFESDVSYQYIIAIIYQVITPLVKYRVSGGPDKLHFMHP